MSSLDEYKVENLRIYSRHLHRFEGEPYEIYAIAICL
jgi:hypothetical protein